MVTLLIGAGSSARAAASLPGLNGPDLLDRRELLSLPLDEQTRVILEERRGAQDARRGTWAPLLTATDRPVNAAYDQGRQHTWLSDPVNQRAAEILSELPVDDQVDPREEQALNAVQAFASQDPTLEDPTLEDPTLEDPAFKDPAFKDPAHSDPLWMGLMVTASVLGGAGLIWSLRDDLKWYLERRRAERFWHQRQRIHDPKAPRAHRSGRKQLDERSLQ